MTVQQFLIRPFIMPKESLSGYLVRLCLSNGYSQPNAIRNKFLTSTIYQFQSNLLGEDDLRVLSVILNKKYEEINKHNLVHWNQNIIQSQSDKYLLKNKVKYCPICLQEYLHHQYIWGLNMVCMCIKHKCELIDKCFWCSSYIDIRNLYLDCCSKCKVKYSNAKFKKVSTKSAQYLSQKELQEGIQKNKPLLKELGNLDVPIFLKLAEASFYLLEGLTDFTERSSEVIQSFRKKNVLQSNSIFLRAFSNVWWMYQNFPNNFNYVLINYLNKKRSQRFIQKEQFEKILNDFPKIEHAYLEFWMKQLDRGLIRKDFSIFMRIENLLEKRSMIGIEEAKKLSRMSREKLLQLAQNGEIRISNEQAANKNKTLFIRESLMAYLEKRNRYVSRNVAAKLLGIQKNSLINIITEGILQQHESKYFAYNVILLSDVENLINNCRGELLKVREQGMLSFHEVLIKFSVCGLSISHILHFILSGKLHPRSLKKDANLSDTLYYKNEIEGCLFRIKNVRHEEKGYYMTEVMKILGIGEKKMRILMEAELLTPEKIITWKDGRNRYLFDKKKVEMYKKVQE